MRKPIPDVHHSVERELIKAVVCQLVTWGVVPQYKHYSFQPVLKARNTNGKPDPFVFKSDQSLTVESTAELLEGANIANPMQLQREELGPIFLDHNLGVAIQPRYKKMRTTLRLKYQTTSLERLEEYRQDLHMQLLSGADRHTHEVQYTYRLHDAVYNLLEEIWKRTEIKAPYGDDFSTFLHQRFLHSVDAVENNGFVQLVVNEVQTGLIGIITPDFRLEIDENEGQYEGTMEYTLYYLLPYEVTCIYPAQIHQSLLPKQYLYIGKLEKHVSGLPRNEAPVGDVEDKPDVWQSINLTPHDDSHISKPPIGYGLIWSGLLSLDTGEVGEVLVNLTELPGFCMPEWMMCYFKNYGDECTKPFKGHLLFSLHRDESLMDVTYLTLTDNLDIVTNKPLNLRDNWHISLSIHLDNCVINTGMDCELTLCPEVPAELVKLRNIVRSSVQHNYKYLARKSEDLCGSCGMNMYTVESVIIETYRFGGVKHHRDLLKRD